MCTSIDYVSGTFKALEVGEVLPFVRRFFGDLVETRGHHGYRQCWRGEGVAIYHDGMPGMGVHVQWSGVGCAKMSNADDWQGWGAEIWALRGAGMTFTRFDIASDDRAGILNMDVLREAVLNRQFTSRWRDASTRLKKRGLDMKEDVLYLGLASSPSSLCIYDKRLERIGKGEDDPGHWIRCELRVKEAMAESAATWIIEHPNLGGIEGILRNSVTFVVEDDDTNKSRRKTCGWWEEFLQEAAKVVLQPIRLRKGIEKRVEHFMIQHAATFQALRSVWIACQMPGDLVTELLLVGTDRLRERHISLIGELVNRWRTEQGLPVGS